MIKLPTPEQYGSWDTLPADPSLDGLDVSAPDVSDLLARRELLKQQWASYLEYPNGFWTPSSIANHKDTGEAWRNWLLRRSWESVETLNGQLRYLQHRFAMSGTS